MERRETNGRTNERTSRSKDRGNAPLLSPKRALFARATPFFSSLADVFFDRFCRSTDSTSERTLVNREAGSARWTTRKLSFDEIGRGAVTRVDSVETRR